MHVVYDEQYNEVYASDPAAVPGRIECIQKELEDTFPFVEPIVAAEADLLLVHSQRHVDWVKQQGLTYQIAVLAVGGALKAAQLSVRGKPAFGLIRPPGHHASSDSSWGFCYFNNVAIAVEKLRNEGTVEKILIVDIDLHYGDGTAAFFVALPQVVYRHVDGDTREGFVADLERIFASQKECDIVAVSAGFDRHKLDWGGLLKTEDYVTVGRVIKEYVDRTCGGRVFAVLEGGYNHDVLGPSVRALLEGLECMDAAK